MNTNLLENCDDRMGKFGDLTLPVDGEVCPERDLETQKDYLSQYSLIEKLETMYNNNIAPGIPLDSSDDDDENSKENGIKTCSIGYSVLTDEDNNNAIKPETETRLTVANVNKLCDLLDAIEFSIENDINIDNLETIEECKERFLLHIEKEKNGSTKKQQIEKAMLKAGNDDENRRNKLKSVMQEMLSAIHKKDPMLGQRRDSELVESLLRLEGTSSNLLIDSEAHMNAMDNGECLVIVAGETSAGKSSVLNLLFEDDILPFHNNSSTSTITIIRYHKRKHAKVLYKDGTPDWVFDLDTEGIEKLHSIAFMKSASERENHNIKEVQVFLPLPLLQSGLVLVDTPGIGENEFLETELINFISQNQIRGFMYIIKTDNAGGVQEDRLLNLLKIVIEKQRAGVKEHTTRFDPKSALFVCNRIDLIKKEELQKVKQNAIDKLSACWPNFDESQVVFFSTERAKHDIEADRDYINDSYKRLLDSIKNMYISALEKRIKASYKWIETVLKRTVHHLKAVLTRLDLSDMDLKTKSETIKSKLDRLQLTSDSVLEELRAKVDAESTDLCCFLKSKISTKECQDALTKNWTPDDLPNIGAGLGNWSWIRCRIQDAFFDKLLCIVENWERDEEKLDKIEQQISFQIKLELRILEEELADIEREIQGDDSSLDSDGISELAKTRRRSIVSFSPTRSPYLLAEPTLPLRLAGRIIKPFQAVFGPLKNKLKANEYRNNPLKVAEECAKTMYTELCENCDNPNSALAELADALLERPREYLNAIEKKMPDMILANQLLLNRTEECIESERSYLQEYELMMTSTESLRRSLMEYGEGYIFVNDFSRGELQIKQQHPDSGDTVSVPFNVTDFLRGSSGDLDVSRMGDIRALWTVTYAGVLCRNRLENQVAIRVYLPSSGVECTFKEVAKLRCLTSRGTGIAEFLGIHNAESASPAFVYRGALTSVRKFMNTFCSKREEVPELLMGTVCGLEYLHNKGLVHMELTQDTITVDETGTVQLTGACLPREAKLPEYKESIETGNFVYLAPEILRGEIYEATADIYSYGLFLIEMLIPEMTHVFKRERKMTLYDFTQNVNPEKMLDLENTVQIFTLKTRALIENCLQTDKDYRPLMSLVVEYSSFVKTETDALERLPSRPHRTPVIKRHSQKITTWM